MVNEKEVSSGSEAVPRGTKPVKMCYIIGPIRSKWGLIGRLINVWRGRQAAVKLWKAGFAVICPHLNSLTIAMAIPNEDEIVRLDCEIIKRCDFVVLLKGYEKSKGACTEINSMEDKSKGLHKFYPYTKEMYYSINSAIHCEKT